MGRVLVYLNYSKILQMLLFINYSAKKNNIDNILWGVGKIKGYLDTALTETEHQQKIIDNDIF